MWNRFLSSIALLSMTALSMTALLMTTLLLCGNAHAESLIVEGDVVGAGGSPHHNTVRSSSGVLFTIAIVETGAAERELRVYRSADQGLTWTLDPVVVNDADSGLSGTELANAAAVAIDSEDRLHIMWGRYYYPSSFAQYYRQYESSTGDLSARVDLSTLIGSDALDRTAAMSLAVDQDDTVWLIGQGLTNWVERLLRSTDAFASSLSFEDLGPVSPSASAQNTRVAIDAAGRVHCVYYRNVAPGNFEHRIYDPSAGAWLPSEVIGDTTGTNDFYGIITTDSLGGAHVMVAKNGTPGSTWDFIYRSWDEVLGWSPEVPVFSATEPSYSGIANYRVFSLGCDEATGDVTALYRDLEDGGRLRTATKSPLDAAFTLGVEIQPESTEVNYYSQLTVRGTLFPAFNQSRLGLDLSWIERPSSDPQRLEFMRVGTGGGTTFRRGDSNADGGFDVSDAVYSLAAIFVPGAPLPGCEAAADANDDGLFDISDAVYMLAAIFIPGSAPTPDPGPDNCGPDPTPDLDCVSYGACP